MSDQDSAPPSETLLVHHAWTIIANAGGGDWERESPEWAAAARAWRDDFHAWLDAAPVRAAEARVVSEDEALLWQAREALRLTREYVWPDVQLPCIDGWSWWDALRAIDERLGIPNDDVATLGVTRESA